MFTTAEDLYRHYRFSVDEYLRTGEAGILFADDGMELIDAESVDRPPIAIPHTGAVKGIANLFAWQLGDRVVRSV